MARLLSGGEVMPVLCQHESHLQRFQPGICSEAKKQLPSHRGQK
jgi:hypothetical protein